MNEEEMAEFFQQLLELRARVFGPLYSRESVVYCDTIVIPTAWSAVQEKITRELFELNTVRADVEKPGVLV